MFGQKDIIRERIYMYQESLASVKNPRRVPVGKRISILKHGYAGGVVLLEAKNSMAV